MEPKKKNKNEGKKGIQASNLIGFRFERSVNESINENPIPQRHVRKNRENSLNKDEYVLANFRFVINPLANPFESCWFHPDTLIPWEIIESVIVPINHENTMICPICLDLVHIPKITKCGHSFCYLCLIRHMKSDRSNRLKCPMCLEYIFLQDLKNVKYENKSSLQSSYVKEEQYVSSHKKNPNFKKYQNNARRFNPTKKPVKSKDESTPDDSAPSMEENLAPADEGDDTSTMKKFIKFRHVYVIKGNISPQLALTTSKLPSSVANVVPNLSNKSLLSEQLSLLQNAIPREDSSAASYSRIMYRSVPAMYSWYEREKQELLVLQKEFEQTYQYLPVPPNNVDENDSNYFTFFEMKKNLQYVAIALENLLMKHLNFEQGLSKFMNDLPDESPGLVVDEPNEKTSSIRAINTAKKDKRSESAESATESLIDELAYYFPNNSELVSHFYQVDHGSLSFLHPLCLRALLDCYSSTTLDATTTSLPTTALENLSVTPTTTTEQSISSTSTQLDTVSSPAGSQPSSVPVKVLLPEILIGKVVEVEKIRLTNSLKQKFSFLRYLPQFTEIEFIEIELKPLLSKAIYSKFQQEIMKRQYKRNDKKKLENLAMKEAEMKRIREEVELQERLVYYNELRAKNILSSEYRQASSAAAVSSISQSSNDLNQDLPPLTQQVSIESTVPQTQFNHDGKISFAEITQLSGNFPALVSSSITSLNPLPSFPSLAQSIAELNGERPTISSLQQQLNQPSTLITKTSISSVPNNTPSTTGWGRISTTNRSESQSVPPPPPPAATEKVIIHTNTPPKSSSRKTKGEKVSLFSTASSRSYRS